MSRIYASEVLTVGAVSREMGSMIFSFHLPLAKMPLNWLRAITAEMLPERLARDFGLPEDSERRRRSCERSIRRLRRVYPRLPKRLRYIPACIEACRRLEGKHYADGIMRRRNRLWLGQSELVSE